MKYIYLTSLESVVRFNPDKTDYIEICEASSPLVGAAIVAALTTLSANKNLAKDIYDELDRVHSFTE